MGHLEQRGEMMGALSEDERLNELWGWLRSAAHRANTADQKALIVWAMCQHWGNQYQRALAYAGSFMDRDEIKWWVACRDAVQLYVPPKHLDALIFAMVWITHQDDRKGYVVRRKNGSSYDDGLVVCRMCHASRKYEGGSIDAYRVLNFDEQIVITSDFYSAYLGKDRPGDVYADELMAKVMRT